MVISFCHNSVFICQDWFNKRLKQLVFDLATQEGASAALHIATDGGGMSIIRGEADIGSTPGYSDDPEVQNVDMMQ